MQSVDFQLAENNMISEYQGNYFGVVCFGKSPLLVNVTAMLVDSSELHGKQALMDAYKNALRVTAVAQTGQIPSFTCKGFTFKGPWTFLRVTENANQEDVLTIVFSMLAMSLHGSGASNEFTFDYMHGCGDTSTTLVSSTTTTETNDVTSTATTSDTTSTLGTTTTSDTSSTQTAETDTEVTIENTKG